MRILHAYARQIPRLDAALSLRAATAARVAQAKNGSQIMRDWARSLVSSEPGGDKRSSGLNALTMMRAANERARAEGMLVEQRRERGEVI